jgi:tetratricopeptide (TPR) repeat protein
MLTGILESTPALMSGPLSQATLIQVLRALFVGRLTGRLVFTREGESLDLRFIAGHVVSGSSGPLSGRLGEIMIRAGVLSRTDLDLSLEQAAREGRRLGPVLVERRVATHAQIEEALRLQVRGILFTAYFWRSGAFQFEPNDGTPSDLEEVSARISTAQLILELIGSLEEAEAVREALGDLDRRLAAVEDPRVRLEGVTLSPGDAFVLTRADGFLTAREILEITPLPRETVERSLLSLLSVGVVEWRTRVHSRVAPQNQTVALPRDEVRRMIESQRVQETTSRPQEIDEVFSGLMGKTHHDVLGVAGGATLSEVRDAYQQLTRRFHPDATGDLAPEQAAKVQAIFMRISEAFNALRTVAPAARAEARPVAAGVGTEPPAPATVAPAAPPPPEPPSSDELLTRAEKSLAERPWEALAAVERVLPEASGAVRQRARLLRARAHLKNPASWRAAEIELREVLQEDPTFADAALLLGAFYKDRGLSVRAASMFRKVLEVRPGHRRATEELRSLPLSEPGAAAFPRLAAARA